MQRKEDDINAHNSKTYMETLTKLTPNQRLELIKKMTVEAWRLQLWPLILQQILMSTVPQIPPPLPPVVESLLPYPTLTPGLHMPQMPPLLPSSSTLPPPVRADAPRHQTMYGFPYMEPLRHPRPYNPPLAYQPYAFYPQNTSYNFNWRMPPVVYQTNEIGPIRNRRRRQVVARHDTGDLFTYEEDCDDDNSTLQ